MIDERTPHPDEERLVAWIDEPETVPDAGAIEAHLAGCAECRRRTGGIEAILAGLRTAPPSPGAAAFAARRDRILAALPERTADRGVVTAFLGWRAWWVPTLAAATLAALLVTAPGPREDYGTRGASLPVQAAAQAAADEAFELVSATDAAFEETDAVVEADVPTPSGQAGAGPLAAMVLEPVEEPPAFSELAEEFAELSAEDQAAILEELSITTFDL